MDERDLIKKVALSSAKKAGRILREGMTRGLTISYKGNLNLVTQIDTLSEQTIVANIRKHFRHHQILAEEGHNYESTSPYRWVIDPLDGTTNYAHRFPYFCVSIAVEFEGVVFFGVIYDPVHEELFVAERGCGVTLNNQPISVSPTRLLRESLLVTGFAYTVQTDKNNNLDHFSRFLMRAQAIRRMGSAALDLCYVACGRFDGFWELNLNPWDTAAGFLIVTEAGGAVTNFAGAPFLIDSPEILATNGKIQQAMQEVLMMKGKEPRQKKNMGR
ncbi:MAG: inositol monophosphatase family protein [Nitrospirota bacterium]